MPYWDRATLKLRAKDVLRKSYWTGFLVMVLYGLFGAVSSGSSGSNFNWRDVADGHWLPTEWERTVAVAAVTAVSVVALIAIAYSIFVANVLEIGKDRFFTLCRYESNKFDEVFYGFRGGYYMNNVKTQFMRNLYTFLWSLLFIIPGIVKYYSYWMIPYILAENPNISTERAFEISMRTTEGEKMEMFVLRLSFIGWYLLGVLACGIGTLFVNPYYEATHAELYGALRYKAVTTGICTRDEIGAEIEIAE